jgi:hypothetical protein
MLEVRMGKSTIQGEMSKIRFRSFSNPSSSKAWINKSQKKAEWP